MLSEKRKSEIMLANIESSDCGVIALQAITGIKREEAEELMAKVGKYEPGVGTKRGGVEAALRSLGYRVEPVPVNMDAGFGSMDTPATFAVTHEYGLFTVYVDGHVMALVEGDLFNSRGCWGKPLTEVNRVKPS